MAKRTGLKLAAAALGAAAGYYFYASPDAQKHRKVAAKWAAEMKADVIKKGRQLKNVDRKNVEAIIMNAAKTYRAAKNLDRAEVERAAKELRANWKEVANELNRDAKSAKRSVRTAVKKSKKTVRKAAKRATA